jgi:Uma2 family endonuclease
VALSPLLVNAPRRAAVSTAEVLQPILRTVPDEFDNRDRYEIIDGVRVEMPPMSADSTGIAADLEYALTASGLANNSGKAYSDMLIRLPLPVDRQRRPDVIFVPFSRWAKGTPLPRTNAWDVLPELCAEVVSPTDLAEELWDKVTEYFRAGVRLVWVVYPRQQHLLVFDSPTQARVLGRADVLDGGAVLPGFRLALAELFPAAEPPPVPPG